MNISFNELFPFNDSNSYKVHLASWNGTDHPLDVFARSESEWEDWNKWRDSRDDYNRDFVFSLIEYYVESDTWLFGGIYKIIGSTNVNRSLSYDIQLTDKLKNFIGRLKITFKRPGRARVIKLETYIDSFEIKEILREKFDGTMFPGYENICLTYKNLESAVKNERADWKSSLSSVKGIYLIRDKNTGKCYVGSAYGENGIWKRWSDYIYTGHGWNEGLLELFNAEGIGYLKENFIFSILEFHPIFTDDTKIIQRESHWKAILGTRENGYNLN
ncbi:GIY-YIG nuclease family protein [Leptospira koniambonensis]|uniref:GIY-YIG nuclease family protein n=1 Tax=Leptospira koniambonensis TaxID=2484950 RepID=UPI003EBE44D6